MPDDIVSLLNLDLTILRNFGVTRSLPTYKTVDEQALRDALGLFNCYTGSDDDVDVVDAVVVDSCPVYRYGSNDPDGGPVVIDTFKED